MNKKRYLLPLFIITLLSGCSLAQAPKAEQQADPLVGVYMVCTEDGERAQHDENWVEYGSESMNTQYGKIDLPRLILPAVYNETDHDFTFPGLEGYALFGAQIKDDDEPYDTAICDLQDSHFGVNVTDFGTTYDLSGTLYVDEETPEKVWTLYHVYQAKDGTVYLTGSGNSFQGNRFSSTITEDHTMRAGEQEQSKSSTFTVSVKQITRTEKLLVRQYDASGQMIETQELPVSFEIPAIIWKDNAAWAVVEEHGKTSVTRTAYNRPAKEEEPVSHTIYIPDENGVAQASVCTFENPQN